MSIANDSLPNPFTPLAWLPPHDAVEYENVRYIKVCLLGVWLWDWLICLPDEFYILQRFGLTPPDACYFLSRITAGWFFFANTLFSIAPLKHCHATAKVEGWASAFTLSINSLLILFRVRAVFFDQRITAPIALDGNRLGQTDYCIDAALPDYGTSSLITAAVYDALVFTAVTIKLLSFNRSSARSRRSYVNMFFTGKNMSKLSRILLHSGQVYYGASAALTIASAVAIAHPRIMGIYSAVMVPLSSVILNIAVTRAYRLLKISPMYDSGGSSTVPLTTIEFRERSIMMIVPPGAAGSTVAAPSETAAEV
ncbi:hypothetical protein EIP91_005859 [Steccherinum ochraceum]|uniref:Uncharacterized protein n=1 Tax=Steccherinum ochraceum TaxID=92696 RepID=A0A4R0R6W2_9APHY|nr:hypothetical protein EIP91_005859 [Steccherinum ochraceum]